VNRPPCTYVFWDIDGTLLTTGRSGIKAFEDALREVAGVTRDLTAFPTSGLTDCMIARKLLLECGVEPDPDTERRLLAAYAARLPECLSVRLGHALPGVVEVLDALRMRDDVVIALLTGNLEAAAWAKLDRYGLGGYFTAGGFANDGYERAEIGRAALHRSGIDVDTVAAAGDVYLVGDSPYDVACANALGLRMIAVATGVHTAEELSQGYPWWLLDRLPSPTEFLTKIGLPC
jgi:phosphoglycolate phosphatase